MPTGTLGPEPHLDANLGGSWTRAQTVFKDRRPTTIYYHRSVGNPAVEAGANIPDEQYTTVANKKRRLLPHKDSRRRSLCSLSVLYTRSLLPQYTKLLAQTGDFAV